MLRVGLTGGVGSGKSTVITMLHQLGAFTSQSDEVGRAMMQPGEAVFRQIVEHFGSAVLRADGHLDRAVLSRIAFQDGRVEELNRIVHPAVIAAQRDWMNAVEKQSQDAVAVVESALLFETRHGDAGDSAEPQAGNSWRTRFDRIVLVSAPEDLRVQRYLEREIASAEIAQVSASRLQQIERDVRARIAAQRSDREKAALSDYVLYNEGTKEELRAKVQTLYAQLQAESRRLRAAGEAGQERAS